MRNSEATQKVTSGSPLTEDGTEASPCEPVLVQSWVDFPAGLAHGGQVAAATTCGLQTGAGLPAGAQVAG